MRGLWLVRRVAPGIIARGESPGIRAVAAVSTRVRDGVCVVDTRQRAVVLEVVGPAVGKRARVESEKGVVREEERPSYSYANGQRDAVERVRVVVVIAVGGLAPASAIPHRPLRLPSPPRVVHARRHRMRW